jgi:hypothetical protein
MNGAETPLHLFLNKKEVNMKDLELNLSFAQRGIRAYFAINSAFAFAYTKWFPLIPVAFYLWVTALCGYCAVKSLISVSKKRLIKTRRKAPVVKKFYREKKQIA